MKRVFVSLILASASPIALAQQGEAGSIRTVTAAEQTAMAGASVKAPLPNSIEKAVMGDWFESELGDGVHSSVSEAARRAYVQRMYEPVWTPKGAESLRDAAADLDKHGLTADEVLGDDLDALIEQRFSASDDEARAEADLALSASWLRIASAISGKLSDEGKAATSTKNAVSYPLISEKLVEAGRDDRLTFEDFEPDYPQYAALKGALAQYRDIQDQGGWFAIPEGETLEAGQSDPRVPALRERLQAEGFLEKGAKDQSPLLVANAGSLRSLLIGDNSPTAEPVSSSGVITASAPADDPELYTEDLANAVQAFQKRHGITADGVVGPNTLAALNESVKSKISRISDSMERWREQGATDERYIWANVPSYTVEGWKGGVREIEMKSIVGMASRATPIFNDEIEYVVANPRWYAPVSIVAKDKLPKLQRDASYAERANFKIYNRSTGREVSAYSVNWNDPSSASEYRLVQQPGSNNALGELKIIFPNQHAVYLHGTPGKHLFDHEERAFSSGCIRLEHPDRMAEWIAAQNSSDRADEVKDALSTGTNQRINFERHLPIHITYMTVTVDDEKNVNFWRDIYHRTDGIEQAEEMAPSGQTASADTEQPSTSRG